MNTKLDWSNYHDQGMGDAYADIPKHGDNYAKAISVCIRSGICQKSDNRGVMCPSFRLNEDKQLSPGGRVQRFKALLNQNDDAFIHDVELEQVLSHCVSCKGCKRECENNLDMAAIKVEYLAQRRAAGYHSIRSWLFAEFPFLLIRFPILSTLITMRNRSPLLKKTAKYIVKINDSIILPQPAEQPFKSSRTKLASSPDTERNIVLLVDSFTSLFHPNVATDAEILLVKSGYQVTTLTPFDNSGKAILDSGRSLFSQGYVERTQEQAKQLLKTLIPHVKAGHRIIGLEPSALLMLRDEYLMLGLGEEAKMLAQSTLLFEKFVAREHHAGRFNVHFSAMGNSTTVLVHGHCHQKAVGAMKSMRKAMRLIPNLNFKFIDASCCGMAGSFGLEAEHAQESKHMAEQALLPALDAAPNATIVCNGFSCSHQIYALRGRKPIHLASLLARQLTK
jgi:glycerol-3-phosphate dehydrogenase subunit C